MERTAFLRLVLCLVIFALVEGKTAQDKTELHEGSNSHLSLSKDSEMMLLRNIRSVQKKKKQNNKKGIKNKQRNKKNEKNKKSNAERKTKGKKTNVRKGKKKNKNKIKLRKMRKKGNKSKRKSKKEKERKTKQSTSSCPTTSTSVSNKCLEDAMMSLAYEKNQVTNYIKQAKRLDNHQSISSNKLTKKGEFYDAAKHMLWAIGGNISDPKCGQTTNDTKRMEHQARDLKTSLSNYDKLLNCNNSIHEACDLNLKNETYNHDDHTENMTLCRKYKQDFINVSKECISTKDQTNATLQCECWHKAAKDVAIIKKLKCETKDKQKIVTKHKNDCIKAFGLCKKMENEAIELIHTCMHDHSNDFINQTAEGLQEAAEKAGRAVFQERLSQLETNF